MRPVFYSVPALLAAIGVFIACEDTSTPPTDYSGMLHTMTEQVILPANASFAQQADALQAAMKTLESAPDAGSLDAAQKAWRATRAAWRTLDACHFGPVADLGITERIDDGPADGAAIDAIVTPEPTDANVLNSVASLGGASKGFLGMEYLLFGADAGATALARLQGDGVPSRRRTVARAMADEIQTSAHQLQDAWTSAYAAEVENAGTTSKRYPTQRAAVDDLVGGVGYALELVVGVRLAEPLGLKSGGAPDPKMDPTTASDSDVADDNASLAGVRALYQGDGFSSRVKMQSSVLDARVLQQLDDCVAKVTAIPAPFATTLTGNAAVVNAAYASCRTLKDTWNTDVTSQIGASLKPADPDGD